MFGGFSINKNESRNLKEYLEPCKYNNTVDKRAIWINLMETLGSKSRIYDTQIVSIFGIKPSRLKLYEIWPFYRV